MSEKSSPRPVFERPKIFSSSSFILYPWVDGLRDWQPPLGRGRLVTRSWGLRLKRVLVHQTWAHKSDIGDRPCHSHKGQSLKRALLQSFQSLVVNWSSTLGSKLSRDCHPLFHRELGSTRR